MGATLENENTAFDVEFMSLVVDKADNLRVLESDSHFADFTGVHPSKIKQGKLFLHTVLNPKDRETVMKQICKKNSPYVYLDFNIKGKDDRFAFVHCIGQSVPNSTLCRLALADISRSEQKTQQLQRRSESLNRLIDLVEGGVCLFKVTQDMQFEVLYMNKACARYFGAAKDAYLNRIYKLDTLIHKEDKSAVFQAIGNTMATKKPIDMELRVLKPDKSYIWCKMNSAIQRYDEDGSPVLHAVFTDITKVKEAEQHADSEREVMVNIFKNLPGPLFCTGFDTLFLLDVVSTDFIRLIGYSRTEFFEKLGGDFTRLMLPEDVQRAKEELKNVNEKQVSKTYYRFQKKDGTLLTVVDRRRLVIGKNGEKSTIGILKRPEEEHLPMEINL